MTHPDMAGPCTWKPKPKDRLRLRDLCFILTGFLIVAGPWLCGVLWFCDVL